jgi:hypothetical protein
MMRREATQAKAQPDEPSYRTRYTIWLNLTIVSLGTALAPFVAEWYRKRSRRLAAGA